MPHSILFCILSVELRGVQLLCFIPPLLTRKRMKRNLFAITLLVLSMLLLVACNQDSGLKHSEPNTKSINSLTALYPSATDVTWRVKGQYDIASFKLPASAPRQAGTSQGDNEIDMEAWFVSQDGSWRMSKESEMDFDQLPEAVQKAFKQSIYAEWKVDDVVRLEREGAETLYVIEVEQGNQEMHLFYSVDGILVRAEADLDDDYEGQIVGSVPSFVQAFLQKTYPNARIIEIDEEDGMIEVEILDGRIQREILFQQDGTWVSTCTEDILLSEVPEAVLTAFKNSEYANYTIDEIEHFITPDKEFYRFELELKGAKDIKIDITLAGEISIAPSKDQDNHNDSKSYNLPDAVRQIIESKYPGAQIKDVDYENGLLEVEIIHEGRDKEVYFTDSSVWSYTSWELSKQEVPAAVLDALTKAYPNDVIDDDIHFVETPQGQYYAFELERGNDIEVFITPAGEIVDSPIPGIKL